MHQVGAGAAVGDGQVDAEGLEGAVGVGELGEVGVRRGALLVARRAEGVHLRGEVVAGAQRADQLGDVHAGAAVDLGWVLLGQHVDPHGAERYSVSCDYGMTAMTASASVKKVLAIVLAGGEGKRLMPLTADRAKPAVPFAGIYRLIDFALSNVVNSGYLRSSC